MGCKPVSHSKLAVWDVPGAMPPKNPVLSIKWDFAEQHPSAGLLAEEQRCSSIFSLI